MNLGDNINEIYPNIIDNTNFRYIKIDNIYSSSIIISNFPRYASFLQIIDSIPKKYSYDMSIFIRKQDNMKVLKDLTYYISSSASEIKTSNKNQIDIDLISKVKDDAKELRKQIQINGQEVFFINILITFYSENKNLLYERIREIQSVIYSKGLTSNIANFRHLDSYLLNLPLNKNKEKLLELSERTFTTNALSNVFPFYTKTIFDKNGVIFGFTQDENKICNIDIFDKKYINSNICILGSSGSGKSYFTKLMVIRLFLNGKSQYIIDPAGEYVYIAKSLNCNYFEFNSKNVKYYYNPFEILEYEIFLHENNVINYKIEYITDIICFLCSITESKEIIYIKDAIRKVYEHFNIKKVEDVYNKSSKNKLYVDKKIIPSNKFPIFLDLIKFIDFNKLKNKIESNIIKKYKIFTSHTNINYNNKLFVFDTSTLDKNIDIFFVNLILENIVCNLKYIKYKFKNKENNANNKTIIYIDEVWKYIKSYNDNKKIINIDLGGNIFELFKTIRKYNASIVAITQDISDFFLLEDGSYGKSIINNSNFKIFFKLDFSDSEFLEKYYILDKNKIYKVNRLNKGQSLICFKNTNLILNVKANKYEEEILEEDACENYNSFE